MIVVKVSIIQGSFIRKGLFDSRGAKRKFGSSKIDLDRSLVYITSVQIYRSRVLISQRAVCVNFSIEGIVHMMDPLTNSTKKQGISLITLPVDVLNDILVLLDGRSLAACF